MNTVELQKQILELAEKAIATHPSEAQVLFVLAGTMADNTVELLAHHARNIAYNALLADR